jgi:hypothetical protein
MSAAEVGELAGELPGAQPGEWLTGLMGQAGGNPLYVRELVDTLARDGRVRSAGGVAESAGDAGVIRVSASLAAAISERLGVLPAQTVAFLVAEGQSNPDIAAALFLSRYTVQTHVSHILAKLGAQLRVGSSARSCRPAPPGRPAADSAHE